MPATQDNFEFIIVGDRKVPFDGYVSTDDPTNSAPNVLVRGSQNVYKSLSQQVINRCGLLRRGAGDPSENGVITDFVWYDSTARTIPVRVLADGKVQFESDAVTPGTFVWYTLQTTVDHTRYIFSPWWDDTEQKDLLTMVNGSPNIYAWSGGIATIASVGTQANGINPAGLTIDVGGVGITEGSTFEITGGGGSGAIFEATTVVAGVITVITLLNPGSGYSTGVALATTIVSGTTGGDPTVNVASLANYGTITKAGTETWLEEGFIQGQSINVNGVSMIASYGLDSTTLVTTGNPAAAPVGSIVYSEIVTTTNAIGAGYSIDFSIVNNNQLIIGSYSSRIVYGSYQADYTNFTPTGSLEANLVGNPFILTLDDTARGLAVRNGNLQISAGLSNWYEIVIDKVQIPNSDAAVYLQAINVNKKPGANLSAALGQEFIANVGDDVYYVALDHQIYVYGSFTNQFSSRFPALSQAIRDELTDEDFTGGSFRTYNDAMYLTSITSGKTYTYSARQYVDANGNIVAERLWYPPQLWNISRISVIDGVLFGASSENPQYYQLFDTGQFHDDTPTTDVAPYECVARWSYWQDQDRTKLLDLDKIYVEGYLAENSPLSITLRLDYLGSTETLTGVISALEDNPTLFTDEGVVPIGGGVGDHLIGGGGLDEFGNPDLPKFRVIMPFERFNVFEYQFELYSYTEDSQWRILALGSNASEVVNKPVFLLKTSL